MRQFALAVSLAIGAMGCGGACLRAQEASCLRTLSGHSDSVCSVALTPDGKQLASGAADGKIKFWDVESGRCLRTLDGHEEWVQAVALSSDGRSLASGGRDNLVKLWDVESGKQRRAFAGHEGLVKSVAYSPDGRLLASCGRDKVIRLWEVASGKSLKTLGTDDFFTSSAVEFTPDSQRVLFGGDSLQLWDIASGELLRTFKGHRDSVGAIAISRVGRWFASGGSFEDRTLSLWDARTGDCVWNKQFNERVGGAWSVTFAANDNLLVSGHYGGGITFWDVKSGNELRTVKAHSAAVSSLAVDAKGQLLASGSWDNSIKLWKVSSIGPPP